MAAGNVLIVEDEAIVAQDLSSTVERLGYEVVEIISSGTLAVTKAAQLKPDVVLMDITLDGDKDGVMAAKVISGRMNIPVIFVTAHTDKNTIDRARATMPSGYVVKPFDSGKISAAIQKALDRPPAPGERPVGKASILMIDDLGHTQAAVTKALPKGQRIKMASSFSQARRFLTEGRFDLIIINIELPDANGGAAIRELRLELKVSAPVIAVADTVTAELAAFVKSDVSALLESSQVESRLDSEIARALRR